MHPRSRMIKALTEFVKSRRAQAFAREMREMAADPHSQAECAAIEQDFASAALDGLRDEAPPSLWL